MASVGRVVGLFAETVVAKNPYLLMDAGGTVLFADQDLLAQVALAEGFGVDPDRFYEAHFRLVYGYDAALREKGTVEPWTLHRFFQGLFLAVGVPVDAATRCAEVIVEQHKKFSVWTYTKPWVPETLAQLRAHGFRMAVISNADGRVRQQLKDCRIDGFFDAVFDSAQVGIEKPDPGLFVHALNELGLAAWQALYIGDVFYIDVLGANRAEIAAVHLDPLRQYAHWPGVHVPNLRALPAWLRQYRSAPDKYDLHPLYETRGGANDVSTDGSPCHG